jgi:DNA modification methylase
MDEEALVSVESIIVEDRARTELGDLEQLQNSIKRLGQLNAIIVHKKDNGLVAGYRRYICHKNLGLKKIRVKYYENLSDLEKKVIELEENLHKELEWDEQSKLRAEIHMLLQKEHGKAVKGHKSGGWSLEDSANYLNVAIGTISQDVALIEAMKALPKIAEFSSKKQALKSLGKIKEMAILTELARRDKEEGFSLTKSTDPYMLFQTDSVKYIKENVDNETIDLVIFDPPWGINADDIADARGPRGEKTFYDDSEETSKNLIHALMPELYRVMKADSHMYMFIGAQFAAFYVNLLQNQKPVVDDLGVIIDFNSLDPKRKWRFDVRSVPLVWVKEGGGYTDFEYKFMPRYENILFCTKGRRPLNYVTSDVFILNRPLSTERIHPQQRSLELLKEFIKLSSHQDEIVLDPTMGSGAVIVAAILTGRRSIGVEKDAGQFLKAENWIKGIQQGNGDKDE